MTNLTPVTGLSFKVDPKPMGQMPRLEWIPLDLLRIDHSYQRQISAGGGKLIRRIVAEFDWSAFKALNVSENTDGTYDVTDGQHSAIALATHGEIDMAPCLVTPVEHRPDRAKAFVAINTNRTNVSPAQTFYAKVTAEDPAAVEIAAIAEACGVNILKMPRSGGRYLPKDCVAVTELQVVHRQLGPDRLKRILAICANAELEPIRAVHLKAVRALVWSENRPDDATDDAIASVLLRDGEAILAQAKVRATHDGVPVVKALAARIGMRCGKVSL